MMKKKTLHLDITHTLTQSFGRFLSIMCLMGLGAFGLVGLKVTGPDINSTVQQMLSRHHSADLTIIADYGLSQDDINELQDLNNSTLEVGYFSDTVIKDTPQSIRVFSKTQNISIYQLVSGEFPQNEHEVALSSTLQNDYAIGETLTLSEDGKRPLLANHTFKITGFITSNEFLSTNVLGISTAGSGTLHGFAIVKPTVFNSDVYTIARLRFNDLAPYNTFSKEYENKLINYKHAISEKLKDNGAKRLQIIQQTTHTKIRDGESQIDEALTEINRAKQALDNGQSEINAKQQEISNGFVVLSQNEKTLKQSKQTLDNAKNQLDYSKKTLDEGKQVLDAGLAQIEEKKQLLENTKKTLEQSLVFLTHAKTQLDKGKEQLQQLEQQITQAEQLLTINPSLAATQNITPLLIAQWSEQLRIHQKELLTKEQQYEQGKRQYDIGKTQYDTGLEQLNSNQILLEKKHIEYTIGLQHYQTGLADYQNGLKQYQDGLEQLDNARITLTDGQIQLEQAQRTLDEHFTTFNTEQEKANNDILIAQQNISNAKADLQELIEPKYHVYTRASTLGGEGYTTIQATSQGISAVGNLFPLILYGVAALVTVTTMTRFVNEERTKAGILKALGYTNRDIYKKFIVYGFASSTIGTLIGILAGTYFLPYMLGETLLSTTVLPKIQLLFYWDISLIALLCSTFCSVIPALWIAKRELKASAAQLLLPKPPANAAAILLERIPLIWHKLSFTQKVTARNIFRYKQRMLMTIFGVAGSLALLFSGLGILSSLSGMVDRQYGAIIQYDALVAQHSNIREEKVAAIQSQLQNHQIKDYLPLFSTTYTQKIDGINIPQSITVLSTRTSFDGYINLFDSETKNALSLVDDGVYITEKLAKQMYLKVGDKMLLDGTYTLKIAGIVELYAGHFIFMNDVAYEQFFNTKWNQNAYLIKFNDTSNTAIQQTTAQFMALDGVKTVVQNTTMQKTVTTLVNSLTTVMFVLTAVSILIGIVILYNLTTINVAERIRELSTIKVLGFFNNEVTLYIYRETIILSTIGMILGLIFGRLLHRLIINTVATPIMMFNPNVDLWVYILPCIIISSIVAILGIIVNKHLKQIEMLEALKSIE